MKKYINTQLKLAFQLSLIIILISSVFTACDDDEKINKEPFFYVENEPTGLTVGVEGSTKSYVVRSNQSWQIVAQSDDDWVRPFPSEGEDDGKFSFIVDENNTFDSRTMNFAFIVDGEEQPVLFRIDQEANIPFITITGVEDSITIPSAGEEITISVEANVDWAYSLGENTWLSEVSTSESEIKLLAAKNIYDKRSVVMTISADNYSELTQEIILVQSSGNIILEEDFNWLTYGSIYPYEYQDAVRYDNWTQEEKDKGWSVTPNEFSSDQPLCYACYGYVKLGKTKYGGDLISPKLDIDGTVNLEVTFKSAVYISAGGNVDDRNLKVFVLGAGETSVTEFTIDNVPNSQAEDAAGIENDIWAEDRAYSFTVTGATSETQIKFLGGDYNLDGVDQGKNRILLDDIKVKIIE